MGNINQLVIDYNRSMNQSLIVKEGVQLPSYAFFGNHQILYHQPNSYKSNCTLQIKSIVWNQSYNNHKRLYQKLAYETMKLHQQLQANQFSLEQNLIYYTKLILTHIVHDADKQGMCLQHKILYLTFKYFAFTINKVATKKGITIQVPITIQSWLMDVHSLLYKPQITPNLEEASFEDQLIESLKIRDYQTVFQQLNELSAIQFGDVRKKKLTMAKEMLLAKIDSLQNQSGNDRTDGFANKLFEHHKLAYNEQFKSQKKKHQTSDDYQGSFIDIICEVLVGNFKYIEILCKGSWPLFLTHLIESSTERQHLEAKYKQQVMNYLKLKNIQTLPPKIEFILSLLNNQGLHTLYQSLFQFVSPYASHLIAYYFHQFQQINPLISILQEDYLIDLVRNLLDHSSQISSICLFTTYAFLQSNDIIQKKQSIFQTLLYNHLNVTDLTDSLQINQYLQKINLLANLRLQKYCFTFIKSLFDLLREQSILNSDVIKVYLFCVALYQKHYDFRTEFLEYVNQCYSFEKIDLSTLIQIKTVRNQLKSSKKLITKMTLEFDNIQPIFDKFFLLQDAKLETNLAVKLEKITYLLSSSIQSITLLEIVEDIIVLGITNDEHNPHQETFDVNIYNQFIMNIRRFVDHYPHAQNTKVIMLLNSITNLIY